MIKRILQINNELDGSIFLFGARQTGKTTALLMQFPNAIYIDLLVGFTAFAVYMDYLCVIHFFPKWS